MNTFYGIEQAANRRIAELRKQKAEITLGAMLVEQDEDRKLTAAPRQIVIAIRKTILQAVRQFMLVRAVTRASRLSHTEGAGRERRAASRRAG